jgi:hypothetical protein
MIGGHTSQFRSFNLKYWSLSLIHNALKRRGRPTARLSGLQCMLTHVGYHWEHQSILSSADESWLLPICTGSDSFMTPEVNAGMVAYAPAIKITSQTPNVDLMSPAPLRSKKENDCPGPFMVTSSMVSISQKKTRHFGVCSLLFSAPCISVIANCHGT